MDKTIAQIHQALTKLIGLHRQLLDVVRAEREAIVQASLKGIQEATTTKQALVEAIRLAESERLRHAGELALAWKRPLRELTLPNLVIAIQGSDPQGAEQLRSAYNALTLLIQRITEQNDDNHALVERSLQHVSEMKRNVLGEAAPKSNTYTSQGQRANPASGARLISREA